jgi:hypothetical protein
MFSQSSRAKPVTTQPSPPPPPPSWIGGLDLGMMSDYTALALVEKTVELSAGGLRRNKYAVRHLQRWLGVDYPTVAEELRPLVAAVPGPPVLVADETGVGVGVVQILRRANLPISSLVGITITAGHEASPRPSSGWNVPKKELVAAAQSALQGHRLVIAPALREARTLRQELSNFKVKINIASATESFEAWREGQHDDLVLACCLAVWQGEQAFAFWAEPLDIPQPQPVSSWRRRGWFGYERR